MTYIQLQQQKKSILIPQYYPYIEDNMVIKALQKNATSFQLKVKAIVFLTLVKK
jgi:hypothetical protein